MNRGSIHRYMRTNPHSRRGANMYAAVLLFQLLDRIMKLDPKPPITLLLIFVNLVIHGLPRFKNAIPPDLKPAANFLLKWTKSNRVCLNPRSVLAGQRWRLLVSSFVHISDLHVLYNCTSFLYKGVTLESALGSPHFLALIVYLSFFAHAFYVLIALGAREVGFNNIMNNCVVGFSGVIFGLKTVLNSDSRYGNRAESIFGFRMPGGRAPWAELLLASALMPNVSFLGHLCGILAGLTYVYIPKWATSVIRGRGPGRYAR